MRSKIDSAKAAFQEALNFTSAASDARTYNLYVGLLSLAEAVEERHAALDRKLDVIAALLGQRL